MAGHFVLNTGAKIPTVGLGTWQAEPGVVADAIYTAVKVRRRPQTMPASFFQCVLCENRTIRSENWASC
jgi:hypothetical protein